jgi:hypothetical protein
VSRKRGLNETPRKAVRGRAACLLRIHYCARHYKELPADEMSLPMFLGSLSYLLLLSVLSVGTSYGGCIFMLTRDPLKYRMLLVHTTCARLQHITEPILTEPHSRCRHSQRTWAIAVSNRQGLNALFCETAKREGTRCSTLGEVLGHAWAPKGNPTARSHSRAVKVCGKTTSLSVSRNILAKGMSL